MVSWLVAALSPENHKGLYQGWWDKSTNQLANYLTKSLIVIIIIITTTIIIFFFLLLGWDVWPFRPAAGLPVLCLCSDWMWGSDLALVLDLRRLYMCIDLWWRSPRAHLHVVGMSRFMSDINQPSLPTPFYSVLVSVSVFMALSTVFHSIHSPDNSPFSNSVLPVLSLCFTGPFNCISLYESLLQPWGNPFWLTGLKAPTN